jgi:hypothetical protein
MFNTHLHVNDRRERLGGGGWVGEMEGEREGKKRKLFASVAIGNVTLYMIIQHTETLLPKMHVTCTCRYISPSVQLMTA